MGDSLHVERRGAPRFPLTAEIEISSSDYAEHWEEYRLEGVNISKTGLFVAGQIPHCVVGLEMRLTIVPGDPLPGTEVIARASVVRVEQDGFAVTFLDFPKANEELLEKLIASCNQDATRVHGNRRSKVFHTSGCRYFECKDPEAFESPEAAEKAGYRPHAACVK